jgi:hypothetical protein
MFKVGDRVNHLHRNLRMGRILEVCNDDPKNPEVRVHWRSDIFGETDLDWLEADNLVLASAVDQLAELA